MGGPFGLGGPKEIDMGFEDGGDEERGWAEGMLNM